MKKKKQKINTENHFFIFLNKKKKIFIFLRNFFTIIGITLFILILIEIFFLTSLKKSLDDSIHIGAKYHPYLGYTAFYRDTNNYCINEKNEEMITIFIFGGSSIWGLGVKNEETIPSYLSEILCGNGFKVKIKNYGQFSYTNTQEIILLLLSLRKNDVDIVIFYDGVNDSIVSAPGELHINVTREIFYRLRHATSPLSFLVNIMVNIFDDTKDRVDNYFDYNDEDYFNKNKEDLFKEIVDVYLHNIRIVKGIEDEFGLKSFFYWQPSLITKKNLSLEEKNNKQRWNQDDLLNYSKVNDIINQKDKDGNYDFINLMNIFDDYKETIFITDCHKLPTGNKIIAERMAEDVINYLKHKKNE